MGPRNWVLTMRCVVLLLKLQLYPAKSSDSDGIMFSNDNSSDDFPLYWKIFFIAYFILNFYCTFYCFLKPICCGSNRTSSPRNHASRGNLIESNPDHHRSLQFQGRGLELCVISSLPMSQFKKNESEGEGEKKRTNTECAICLGEFEEDEWVKELPNCTHIFHVSCIDTWFQSHSSCPICRSKVQHNNLTLDIEC